MARLTVSDLLVLSANSDDPEKHAEQLLKWHHDRMDAVVRLSFGALATVVVAFAAASFRSDSRITIWHFIGLGIVAVTSVVFSVSAVRSIRKVDGDYLEALRILRELEPLVPILRSGP